MTGFTIQRHEVLTVGIAGGSGSGKTTFARAVRDLIGPSRCAIISQDSYYIDQSAQFTGDGEGVNFDHPDALDFPLLAAHVRALKLNQSVPVPIYDFATHKRSFETQMLMPHVVIIVDRTLIFHPPDLRALFSIKVFIDAPEATRFERRLRRDTQERGRTADGVKKQFERQVKPMHDRYVEPCRAYAEVIYSGLAEGAAEDFHRKIQSLRSI